MTHDAAFRKAEKEIAEARRTGATKLHLSRMRLTELPESLGQLTQLQTLHLNSNQLTALPESLGQLTQLRRLCLNSNQLTALPESLGHLTQLQTLELATNIFTKLPAVVRRLINLQHLSLNKNELSDLPLWLHELRSLEILQLIHNPLHILPKAICTLIGLKILDIRDTQITTLPPEIAKLTSLTTLVIGSGQVPGVGVAQSDLATFEELPEEVGDLVELTHLVAGGQRLSDLPSTLGQLERLQEVILEKNPLNPELAAANEQGLNAVKKYLRAKAEASIVLNEAKLILIGEGDVGKTSLLGALRGDEWVENRKTTHGVEVDIKSLVLRDPDSRTEITLNGWDFGGQNIYRHTHQLFFTAPAVYLAVWNPRRGPEQCCVDEWIKMVKHRAYDETRPDDRPRILVVATHGGPKERSAHIDEQLLRDEFDDLIVGFHHVDSKTGHGLDELKTAIARTAAAIPSVGRSVPASWKNVLDALRERSKKNPYITFKQFQALCRRQKVTNELADTYAVILNELGHLIHYRGHADLQDTVILKPEWLSKAMSYVLEDELAKEQNGLVQHGRLSEIWNDPGRPKRERYPDELHPVFLKLMERFDLSYRVVMPEAGAPETSLVAQLVPGGRPEGWEQDWPPEPEPCDGHRTQVCRIVDAETGRTAQVEGLLYRLIVRLHRYSLGRNNYFASRHWKTGMILDDDFNGRAFVEEIGGDVYVTVRAAYPERLLFHLCSEIRWLVDHFWKGLDCRLSVPCHPPCKGLHELEELIEAKKEGVPKIRCSVCKTWYTIDSHLTAVAPKPPIEGALADLKAGQADIKRGVAAVSVDLRRLISQADEQFDLLMTALTDPAKDGPRLFSFEAVDPGFWDKPKWIAEKFHLTLWCEHSRLPLPALTGDKKRGVYEVELTRDWVKRSAPLLKVLSGTLSLALPIASSVTKLAMNAADYKAIENQLNFGKSCAESFLKAGDKVGDWLTSDDDTEMESGRDVRAQGAMLRELHALLKAKDSANRFGGLVRVQNKRREFLWVHEQYVSEY